MIIINKLKILSLLILSGMLITPTQLAKAEEIYDVSESDLIKLLEKYKNEEVVMENGLVLSLGEAVNLPVTEVWTVYNENVAEVVNGELVAKSVGSTFVSQQTDDVVYILEVCITEDNISTASYARSGIKKVNRDYYKVFIDPGHGGYDNGAVKNGVYEDEINLQISKKIESKLKAKGVQVKMSRYDDTYLSLTQRTNMANNEGSDVFVSIHQNSAENSSAKGIETYYYSSRSDSRGLANDVQNDIIDTTGSYNRGVKTANYAVIRNAQMSSNLVECGFISNPTEAKNLTSSSYQDKVAEGIVSGIIDYLNDNVILNNNSGNNNAGNNNGSSNNTIKANATVKVNGSLNVRSGAGTSYSVVGSLKNGANVEVVENVGNWYKIKYGSGYGYVSKDYVSMNSNTNTGNNNGSSNNTIKANATVKVNGSLNVRSGAGTSYSIVGSLKNGANVEIVETVGNWYKIKYGSGYGYVSKDYISMNSNTNTGNNNGNSSTATTSGIVKVSDSLNVRSGAGTSYSVVGSLKNGANVEVVETVGNWYKIKYGSGYGYVSKDYITLKSRSIAENTSAKKGTVVTFALKVRESDNFDSNVIGTIAMGEKISVLEEQNEWGKISYNGTDGYILNEYIDFNIA